MTLTKKTKKILLISISAAVVVAVVVIVLCLTLAKPQRTGPFAILRSQATDEMVSCKLQQGMDPRGEFQPPLDFYQFDVPEGWQQTVDAAQTANRLSNEYVDEYVDDQLKKVVFVQRPAVQEWELLQSNGRWSAPEQAREVWFGDRQLIYGKGMDLNGEASLLYWVQGNSLLYLQYSGDVDLNRMLELVTWVEPTPTRQPIYSDLTVHHAEVTSGELPMVIRSNGAGGNPQLPEDLDALEYPSFPSAPEGYTLLSESETNRDNYLSPWVWIYENPQGDRVYLSSTLGSASFFDEQNQYDPKAFHGIPHAQLGDASLVQDVQVNGSPALLYQGEGESSIGWADGIFSVELRCSAPMTAQELIALAQTVTQ